MISRSRLVYITLLVAGVLGIGGLWLSQSAEADSPQPATLVGFQALAPQTGWALLDSQLYWTESAGESWKDISPTVLESALLATATFADTAHGWVVTLDAETGRYTLARTADGGQTWHTLPLDVFATDDVRALASRLHLFFLDERLGWLMVKQVSGGAFSVGTLFKTEDGGATWKRLDIPIAGQIHFDTAHDGSLVGGVTGQENYFTRDGGQTWTPTLTVSPKALPAIQDHSPKPVSEVSMATVVSGWSKATTGQCDEQGCSTQTQLLRTDDGGETWVPMTLPNGDKALVTTFAPSAVAGVVGQDANALRLTYDGQGFDSCTRPSTSNMQLWYNYSPYKVWNLYLGGVSLAGLCRGLTTSYVSQLAQQGWLFIPTWVGPQASCTTYPNRMSSDPATAYTQGQVQADLALDVATQFGLTLADQSGGIIYYDLEAYSGASAECRDATQAFISGWVDQLHANGSDAGVYGGTCSSYLYDFADFQDPPDDIWMAYWTSSSYNPNASVFTMPPLCDQEYGNDWMNAQRIRQYAGDHPETHSDGVISVTINIDSDVISGTVSTVLGNCTPTANQVAFFVYAEYGGQCVVKAIGSYPDFNALGLPNDSISAIRVGSNVTATVFQHTNFNGTAEQFSSNDNSLSNNAIGNDQVSSAIVALKAPAITYRVYLPMTTRPAVTTVPLTNGNFESGRVAWVESSAYVTQTLIVMGGSLPYNLVPHGGSWAAKLGQVDDEVASIQQTLTVPANAPYLAYWHLVVSDETGCNYDDAIVLVNDFPQRYFGLCTETDTNGWVFATVDLTAFAGQSVSLKFQVTTDGSVASYWLLDDVSFQSAP